MSFFLQQPLVFFKIFYELWWKDFYLLSRGLVFNQLIKLVSMVSKTKGKETSKTIFFILSLLMFNRNNSDSGGGCWVLTTWNLIEDNFTREIKWWVDNFLFVSVGGVWYKNRTRRAEIIRSKNKRRVWRWSQHPN